MKTTYRIRQPYRDIFMECADNYKNVSPASPERFIEKMKRNTGMAGVPGADGLQKKNPVIVALGDSVTAGHFESLIPLEPQKMQEMMISLGELIKLVALSRTDPVAAAQKEKEMRSYPKPMEVYDAQESYIEKFRNMLIGQYEQTSVSILNAGIAGDNIVSMSQRAERDVIRYQPDLVLINGSLNWGDNLGTNEYFGEILRSLVKRIKNETEADIILLTPNGDLPNILFEPLGMKAEEPTTAERCELIRDIAVSERVCLADVRKVWDLAQKAGCPWEELLANKVNHPSVEGHEVYAKVLMQLFVE